MTTVGRADPAAAAQTAQRAADVDFKRPAQKLEQGVEGVEIEKGDTAWAIAASDLGPKASNTDIGKRVAEYQALNPKLDLNKLVVGDQLKVPPKTAWQSAQGPRAPAAPSGQQAAEAAAQTRASQAAAAAEKEKNATALTKTVEAVVGNAAKMKPMTDTDKIKVTDMARSLFNQADKLGVGDQVRGSHAGKELQGVVDDIAKGDVSRGADELLREVETTRNGQQSPLTDGQKQEIAAQAAPLLAKAKELGVSTESTTKLQELVDDSPHGKLGAQLEGFHKEQAVVRKWSPERLAQGKALLAKITEEAPSLLKTPAGELLKKAISVNEPDLGVPAANQSFRQAEIRQQNEQAKAAAAEPAKRTGSTGKPSPAEVSAANAASQARIAAGIELTAKNFKDTPVENLSGADLKVIRKAVEQHRLSKLPETAGSKQLEVTLKRADELVLERSTQNQD